MNTPLHRNGVRRGLTPRGQSTVELALILPTLMLFLAMTIYVLQLHHTSALLTTNNYADEMYKYHSEGLIFDEAQKIYIPEGQFSEHIPPDASIDPAKLLTQIAGQLGAQLGLNELFSKLQIFDTSTYLGAFGEGFTYSLANSTVQNFLQGGSWNDLNAKDLESATWAGAASALASHNDKDNGKTNNATNFFQGNDPTRTDSLSELLGSGAQAGLVGFAQSQGDWKAGVTSAMGGMMNSDTSKAWISKGDAVSQIMKGAGIGAVESSAAGAIGGKVELKTVLNSAASGAVSTTAFAKMLPFSGSDPKNSAMYGAFNGAFSSVLSGGNMKTTLVAAGAGALSSKQIAGSLGGSQSVGYRAATMGYQAGSQYAQGQSLQAIGAGALAGTVANGIGWATNKVSPVISNTLNGAISSEDVKQRMANGNFANDLAGEPSFSQGIGDMLDSVDSSMMNSVYLESVMARPDSDLQPDPRKTS